MLHPRALFGLAGRVSALPNDPVTFLVASDINPNLGCLLAVLRDSIVRTMLRAKVLSFTL